ncbi:MAG: hypothetical protein HRT68_06895 [Flavobacteriaceae bacterium]|nr:hypothetical protein [Flavobacteriaceae bacterium]
MDFDSQNGKVQFDCISLSQIRADCEIDTYVMKNIPAFIEEDFMLSAENYISQIEYEMVSTQWLEGTTYYTKEWKDVDKDIKSNQSLGLESRKTSYFKNILPQEILSLDSDLKKAKSIYYHLQRKLKWNRRLQIFKDYNVKKAFESKTGSLAELNTILLNTLKAQGFNVEMMLLSTRKNGLATKLYPSLSEFNYMIVKLNINDQSYFLDLTDKFKKFGELPFKCYNQYGRVFDFKNSSYWQDLIPKNRLAYKKDIYYDLKEDVIQGKARFKSDGYINQSKRLKYFRDKEAYLKSFEKNETLELLNYEGKNFLDLEKPFIETISFEVEPEEIGEDIYFNPFLFNEFEKNPFQLKERNYPVDFGKLQEYKTQITFEIPEDYDLEFTPEKKLIKTYDNSVVVEINMSKKENKIVLTRYIYINKITLEANQYQNLKRVFQAILDVQNNTILVLKKK